MGQKQINPFSEYQKDYTVVSQTQKDQLLIRHKQTSKEYMLRKLIVKSEQELEQRMKLLSRRRKIKSEHLLSIVNYKSINNDRICGNTNYVSLLIEYPFQSLVYETIHRLSQPSVSAKALSPRSSPLYFQEHELWSILYSCVLGLETLYMNDMAHQSISKSIIFVDKDGVVKIGDPILLGARTNYDRVIEEFENEKRKREESQSSSSYGQETPVKTSLLKMNEGIESSIIVSPELISLCKDHQYYFFDKEKSDVFVMGVIMIELGLLEDVVSVNVKQKAFKTDLSEFFSEKGKLTEKYSPTFLSIIQSMINIDPKKRPTLSQIVEKIEEFSIQENTNSEQNSYKKNPTEPQQSPQKYNSAFKGYSLNNQFDIKLNEHTSFASEIKRLQNNTFKSTYLQPVLSMSSENPLLSSGINQTVYPVTQGLNYHQFPSFSVQPLNQGKSVQPSEGFQESAVKSLFSKKLPIEIKYTQSPLIVPVSNIRMQEHEQNIPKHEFSTPFDNLNLTESNEKKIVGKTIEKESIVQNKFTLFGPNSLDANNLFKRANQSEERKPSDVKERFSFHNFGRIQIPINSQHSSLNTSTLPTPRFQNTFSTNFNININNVTKPLFTPTFHNLNSPNYGMNIQKNQANLNPFNNNFNTYIQSSTNIGQVKLGVQNNIQKNVHESSYDPKRQGFSISKDLKNAESYSVDHNLEPYFHNSSVGYTLPKYRPESTTSEIVQINVGQKNKRSQSKHSAHSARNVNNLSPTKKIIQESESILHREESPPNQLTSQNSLNANQMISNIAQEKLETCSNTSTVKKQAQSSRKNSGKKYSFYKRELNEKLQKIQQPSPKVSAETEKLPLTQQQSPILGQNLHLSYSQNILTQVDFEPEIHSIYVEERQQNGSFYRGYKLNNQRHGNGVLIFADSGFYEGQFNHDQMEGYGKLFYNQHDLAYEGQFKQNCFNGHGILYNNHPEELKERFDFANLANINNFWISYDGYFKEDQKSGKCHIRFTNGEEFEGYCQNNTFEGRGKFKTIDGSYVEGIWKNNVLVEIQEDSQPQIPNN